MDTDGYYMRMVEQTPETRRENAVKLVIPLEWLGDDGYVKLPEYENEMLAFCRERFGKKLD